MRAPKSAQKPSTTVSVCARLCLLLLYGEGRFILSASPTVVVINPGRVVREIGIRTGLEGLRSALLKAQQWGVVHSFKDANDFMCIRLRPPRGMQASYEHIERPTLSIPALKDLGLRSANRREFEVEQFIKQARLDDTFHG